MVLVCLQGKKNLARGPGLEACRFLRILSFRTHAPNNQKVMRTLLLLLSGIALTASTAFAQPFQTLGRPSPQARFFYERIVPNTSVDAQVLRERTANWLQRSLGTRGFDTATMHSPDTLRAYGYLPLRSGDGLRNIAAIFRVRAMPTTSGIHLFADNFYFSARDAVNGERYEIPFEEATAYFEGNTLAASRARFDERFLESIAFFDKLTVEPRPAPGTEDGTAAPLP